MQQTTDERTIDLSHALRFAAISGLLAVLMSTMLGRKPRRESITDPEHPLFGR